MIDTRTTLSPELDLIMACIRRAFGQAPEPTLPDGVHWGQFVARFPNMASPRSFTPASGR